MSRFNTKNAGTGKVRGSKKTVNLAGGEAYTQSAKLELVSILLTSFIQDQFYRGANDTLARLKELLDQVDPLFAAKAAVYARNEFGMRSISHVVAAELAKRVKGESWSKAFFNTVARRPDDITETMSLYLTEHGKPFPNAMKRGYALALANFDAYQIAKYRSAKKGMSLVDVVRLTHPKRTEAIDSLYKGTLEAANTWETKLTKAGQEATSDEDKKSKKKEAWAELIETRKLGYFALLRNLRNIIQQAPECVDAACEMLVDEKLIKKSLVLPFRYLTAAEEIEKIGSRKVLDAMDVALELAVQNVPRFDGRTLVAVDSSGSMVWNKTVVKIASVLAAILYKTNDADLMLFDGTAKYMSARTKDSVTTIAQKIVSNSNGGATNFRDIFVKAKDKYDRIFILSDMQAWVNYYSPTDVYAKYKKTYDVNTKIYSYDLAGYGSLTMPEQDVYTLAGFSEKTFDIIKMCEQDKNALVNTIDKVEFKK